MITAKIIADSINMNYNNKRITTYELEYPRFIHGEFMTHRMLSRNAASSRAIPIDKVIDHVKNNTAMPVHWGKNQAGMQAKEQIENIQGAIGVWNSARDSAISHAIILRDLGLHKQVVNRILEPFQIIKVVTTATEWENFFHLRNHADAQPEIKTLAEVMLAERNKSVPEALKEGQWHIPYVRKEEGTYLDSNGSALSLEDALKVSASCCAQVSYRKSDDSLDKARMVYDRLINSEPVHASPVEHQARAISDLSQPWTDSGITHVNANLWSGNFCGWVQYRQTIPNHFKKG